MRRSRHQSLAPPLEVVAEGEKDKVDLLVKWCRHGPPHSRVTEVDVDWQDPQGGFDGFSVGWSS